MSTRYLVAYTVPRSPNTSRSTVTFDLRLTVFLRAGFFLGAGGGFFLGGASSSSSVSSISVSETSSADGGFFLGFSGRLP